MLARHLHLGCARCLEVAGLTGVGVLQDAQVGHAPLLVPLLAAKPLAAPRAGPTAAGNAAGNQALSEVMVCARGHTPLDVGAVHDWHVIW